MRCGGAIARLTPIWLAIRLAVRLTIRLLVLRWVRRRALTVRGVLLLILRLRVWIGSTIVMWVLVRLR